MRPQEMVDSKLILRAATTAFEQNLTEVVQRVAPAEDMRTEPAMHDDRTAGSSAYLRVSVASARPPARPSFTRRAHASSSGTSKPGVTGKEIVHNKSATSPASAKPAAAAPPRGPSGVA